MAVSYRIAVIGDWESVLDSRALGVAVYPASSPEEAREIIQKLAREDCAVIYLTEQLAVKLEDVIARYKDALRPAIILIPGKEGSLGVGKRSIQSAIERAVGADIL